ncbi:MAG: OsmC family protein [Phycisphaerales bacterium]|nr:OsmC family protein [Phycisphaerales bacterium]
MAIRRTAQARWNGTIKEGSGSLTAPGGALKNTPYSFASRFESGAGTNPEELIAAAHAGCFSMAFSLFLQNAGFPPESIETSAALSLEQQGGGFTITAIHLDVHARIPKIDDATFQRVAAEAKANCPVSKVLNAKITMTAKLG